MIAKMIPGEKKTRKALATYENMLARPNVREGLRAAFAEAGFAPIDAARSLAELASGRAKTVVTTEKGDGTTEVKTTEHPPNVAALKAYYEMTHESAPIRHENLNVNLDVMKHAEPQAEAPPRPVGELGPATSGEVNVFAEEHDDEEEDAKD